MRFFIGKRIHLPIIGGIYTGVSFGGFHHSRVLMPPPGSAPGPVMRGLGIGIELAFLAALIGAWLSLR